MNIKNVEDEIRMIRIEIAENERKVKVAQERLVDVPQLAEDVLDLQRQIQGVHLQENDLSRQLEDPENKKRWRELEGEDPDEEALDAKISIIEERLNSKKEQLLEKELILDEVSNLVEKLKRDATEGRQSTLEVSEKINEFQSRLRDLTRKMKATISELSMCQANIIKYQNERE
jgi:chromosome segregation ATPase